MSKEQSDFERKVRRLFNFAGEDRELVIEWIVELHEQELIERENSEALEMYWEELSDRIGW